jgi:hypothetical protein
MQNSPSRFSLPFPLGILLGLLLIGGGLYSLYLRYWAPASSARAKLTTGLLCKIYPAVTAEPNSAASAAPAEPSLLTGATLKLSGATKASVNDTVVVSLCVESKAGLPEQRQQALKDHLLVQLSATGLQVDPRGKIPASVSTAECLGTAEWTVRANTPGRYAAVLVPTSTDQLVTLPAAKPRWDFDLQQSARLDIQFQSAWTDTVQKFWGVVSTTLGTILVATQIMLNLRQRKKGQAS